MKLDVLEQSLQGKLYHDTTMRTLYATDASAYREMPMAVAVPESKEDIKKIIDFARTNKLSVIPRAAGTSLAGQVVGQGIVVDISQKFTSILSVNKEEKSAWVQPGVIRDELNLDLKKYGLFFGPETSTSNRCMIGGMVGNNACGARSVVYGSTREHLLEIKGYLADGNEVTFGELTNEEFEAKCQGINVVSELEQKIYLQAKEILSNPVNQELFNANYPKKTIPRRNTGYALDLLADTAPFGNFQEKFNFCKLIAGSEGTLFFATEIKLNLVDALKPKAGLVCVHCDSINASLKANLIALEYNPDSVELIDHYILDCTKENIEQSKNRFFVQGDPKAILVVEFLRDTVEEIQETAQKMEEQMRAAGLGYHFPIVYGEDTNKVWNLRKAGLGLLSNIPGDAKAVAVIEDTAVAVEDLPDFIEEFNKILESRNLFCVHYAHAATGELHLRPIIDLKTQEGTNMFRTIATDIAYLVKKYKGSLSGEHGDGRLRGEFIPFMLGEDIYQMFIQVKNTWDPWGVFNPGKIVNTPPMDTSLRYQAGQVTPMPETYFDFSELNGFVRSAEMCNGSGDCRKTEKSGGTMCPSYMATRNEKHTTRARANILRETITHSKKINPFDHEEIIDVLDLCLSCKGCKSECPSNVDMAKLKAEALQQYHDKNGIKFRSKLIGHTPRVNKMFAQVPFLYNLSTKGFLGTLVKKTTGFATERSLPEMYKITFEKWIAKFNQEGTFENGEVYLYSDEFLNYFDVTIGQTAVKLLNKLGYKVIVPSIGISGRTYLSKGMVKIAREIAEKNVEKVYDLLPKEAVLVGIEPSAILTFRDEYPDLCRNDLKNKAKQIAKKTFLIEEFLAQEIEKGKITSDHFTDKEERVRMHGHCFQKALSSLVPLKQILSLPKNYTVLNIPSGCCGMAGSFGYEKEHYEISMNIGELVLFPTIRQESKETIISASGTSCRHQIADGTGRQAQHPVEILYKALK
ncbi:FAD-binding oxidoreductase [Flavobacterium columnare]|uniref:FAD-binding and (Fe-S)-binding domain-containing protein n=1 Tax=Flavobacterium columnare TaxID=996 RepID=UPI0018964630|nr:FAD-binding and (Fe-S)-binding domain-containing protein [Flavobacterium columnare]MBF6651395.1 FAD-binding oxidoreductase [Flavobacterium columnare]MBF6655047.1 FAD-binding oxidoreductase [Flavobacterium columnare]MBF6659295.1 FAD-binding oxidoreductase [Flavobacterium columnare]